MKDPTKDEMVKHLKDLFSHTEHDEFDLEEAMYWFAHDYHCGQSSNLYSVLSTSPYSPGPLTNSRKLAAVAAWGYEELKEEFG